MTTIIVLKSATLRDMLLNGRGTSQDNNPGNAEFRRLIHQEMEQYNAANSKTRREIVKRIENQWKQSGRRILRILRYEQVNDTYICIAWPGGYVSQTLRDSFKYRGRNTANLPRGSRLNRFPQGEPFGDAQPVLSHQQGRPDAGGQDPQGNDATYLRQLESFSGTVSPLNGLDIHQDWPNRAQLPTGNYINRLPLPRDESLDSAVLQPNGADLHHGWLDTAQLPQGPEANCEPLDGFVHPPSGLDLYQESADGNEANDPPPPQNKASGDALWSGLDTIFHQQGWPDDARLHPGNEATCLPPYGKTSGDASSNELDVLSCRQGRSDAIRLHQDDGANRPPCIESFGGTVPPLNAIYLQQGSPDYAADRIPKNEIFPPSEYEPRDRCMSPVDALDFLFSMNANEPIRGDAPAQCNNNSGAMDASPSHRRE